MKQTFTDVLVILHYHYTKYINGGKSPDTHNQYTTDTQPIHKWLMADAQSTSKTDTQQLHNYSSMNTLHMSKDENTMCV